MLFMPYCGEHDGHKKNSITNGKIILKNNEKESTLEENIINFAKMIKNLEEYIT